MSFDARRNANESALSQPDLTRRGFSRRCLRALGVIDYRYVYPQGFDPGAVAKASVRSVCARGTTCCAGEFSISTAMSWRVAL